MAERGAKPDLAAGPDSPADERSVPHGTGDHGPEGIHLDDDNHHQHDDHDHGDDHHRRALITQSSSHLDTRRSMGRSVVLRYSLASLVSVGVSQSVLAVAFGMLHWTAQLANMVACAVATVPSYYLNRRWAWGRRGRSHLWKEVVPFWALAFLGLAISTWAAEVGGTLAGHAAASHAATTAIVMTAALLAFGVLWIGKFAIFSRVLFGGRHIESTAE
jgi:putative flippase GtrA